MRYEKKIRKYFEDHPEIRDKVLEGIDEYTSIKNENIPSFDELYGDTIRKYKKKPTRIKLKQNKKPLFVRKALLIPISLCLAIGVFVLTPVGQALAKNIYQTIIQWFDSGVNIHHGTSNVPPESTESTVKYFKTINDTKTAIDEKIAWNIDNNIIDTISVSYTGIEIRIVTNYATSSNSEITITQTILDDDTEWDANISSDNGMAIDLLLDDETHFVGYVNNNYCFAIAYRENTSVEVFAENTEYDSFVSFLEGIRFD